MTISFPDMAVAARRVLSGYLEREGFREIRGERHIIAYLRSDVQLEFSYYPEDSAPRGMQIGIGIRRADGFRSLGLWAFIPQDTPAHQFSMWDFTTDADLEVVLGRVRDEVLPIYGVPNWRDPAGLVVALERDREARRRAYEERQSDRHLDTARRAFAAKDYRTSLEHYLLADTELSKVDEKRRHIARRELGVDT